MKIKIIFGSVKKLEKNVNAFIAQDGIEVLELQYSSSINGISVMIIYKDIEGSAD